MQLTTKDVASLCRVTPRTVANWVKEGLPVARVGGRNTYTGHEVLEWYVARRVAERSEGGALDYTRERARLTYHQANIAELEAEQKRGHLWPLEVVRLMLSSIIGRARSRLLQIPGKMRNRRPEFEPASNELLEELVREALEELSDDGLPADIRESLERYHAHLEATAQVDLEPVGDSPRRDH